MRMLIAAMTVHSNEILETTNIRGPKAIKNNKEREYSETDVKHNHFTPVEI